MRRAFWAFVVTVGVLATAHRVSAQPLGDLRIYLARHGESASNVAGTVSGWTDSPLTAKGRSQAQDLARQLRTVPLDAIYASSLSRSRQTAETVAAGRLRVSVLPGLRERNWGAFTGKPAADSEYRRRRVLDDDEMDGGESRAMFFARVSAAIADIRRAHPRGAVLIVGHGATNQQVLRALLGLTADQAESINQANDEVYAVDLGEGHAPLLWKHVGIGNLGEL